MHILPCWTFCAGLLPWEGKAWVLLLFHTLPTSCCMHSSFPILLIYWSRFDPVGIHCCQVSMELLFSAKELEFCDWMSGAGLLSRLSFSFVFFSSSLAHVGFLTELSILPNTHYWRLLPLWSLCGLCPFCLLQSKDSERVFSPGRVSVTWEESLASVWVMHAKIERAEWGREPEPQS